MLRITGGRWSGRRLETLVGDGTRPSMDAHRLALLNRIGQDLSGERVLDLFAGTGAYAFECLSRGAKKAVMVEIDPPAIGLLRKNAASLGGAPGTTEIVHGDAYLLPPAVVRGAPYDLVFFAPPYPHFKSRAADVADVLGKLPPLLAEGALVIVQCDTGDFPVAPAGFHEDSRRSMGRTEFVFLVPGSAPGGARGTSGA